MKSSVLHPSLLLGFEIGSRRVKYLHLLSRDIDIFNVIDCDHYNVIDSSSSRA